MINYSVTFYNYRWLDDIVIPGLRQGVKDNSNKYKWIIEVHGNDTVDTDDVVPSDKKDKDHQDEGGGIEKADDISAGEQSHGPAVYVIQKIPNTKSTEITTENKGTETNEPPPIDLRFFSY